LPKPDLRKPYTNNEGLLGVLGYNPIENDITNKTDFIRIPKYLDYVKLYNLTDDFDTFIDIGAGNGRLESIFGKYFKHVDVLEEFPRFQKQLEKIKNEGKYNLRNIFRENLLKSTHLKLASYDMVFTSGVLEALCDVDLINALLKIRSLLKPNGKYFMREFFTPYKDRYQIWPDHNQIIRPMKTFSFLFELTGLRPLRMEIESVDFKNKYFELTTTINVILEKDD
jgi:hypothetical protein